VSKLPLALFAAKNKKLNVASTIDNGCWGFLLRIEIMNFVLHGKDMRNYLNNLV
jgi:hypothetical protein